MAHTTRHGYARRFVALPFALMLGFAGLTACSDTAGSEEGADVEDVQEDDVWGDADELVGEKVTVSAKVNEVINKKSFTIAGTEGGTEPLLVVSAQAMNNLKEGSGVEVTGTVHERFYVEEVEEDLRVNSDSGLYEKWEEQNYIEATKVDTSLEQDQDNY